LFAGEQITRWGEYAAFPDPVIFTKSTPYQRIVLTASKNELRLYLNSNLQFSTRDEYRYHEALVHPGLSRLPQAKRVLILGGGDGLAVREVLRHPRVESAAERERVELTAPQGGKRGCLHLARRAARSV